METATKKYISADELIETIQQWQQEVDRHDLDGDFLAGYHSACDGVIHHLKSPSGNHFLTGICPSCHARPLVSGQETCAACSQY